MAHLSFNRFHDVLAGLLTGQKHLNHLNEAFVVEVHQIFDCLNFADDVLSQELRERCLFRSRTLVEDHYKTANLLQVLHLSANQVLVAFNSYDGNAFVAHICDDFGDKLPQ